MESNVRKAAESYNRTFAVITGTHGVLTLPDANQKPKRIYLLAGDKLPVPKTIWKIVYDRETQMGIAIISPNNPFMETISQGDFLCDDICDRYGWSGRNWKNIDGGFVYCCDLKKFLKVVPTTPRLKVRGVLQFAPTN